MTNNQTKLEENLENDLLITGAGDSTLPALSIKCIQGENNAIDNSKICDQDDMNITSSELLQISISSKTDEYNTEIELKTFVSDFKVEINSKGNNSITLIEETPNFKDTNDDIKQILSTISTTDEIKGNEQSNKKQNDLVNYYLEQSKQDIQFEPDCYIATVRLFMKGDVTINDFADSSKPVYRPKKLVSSVVSVLQTIEKEKSWDEEEEFDFEENEDGNLILVAKPKTVPSKSIALTKQEDFGQSYPLDLWFLLSKYIKPEDVSIFAAICHNSYEVVQTIVFWRGLYERFCKNAKNLPEKYQPGNMNRVYGLKCAVVRALFYVYPLFVSRLLSVTWNCSRNNLSTLLRKQCVLQWYEKKKKDWFYFFKFKDYQSPYHCHNQETENNFNLIKMLGDISANPDNNCVVLQIKSSSFIAIPIVLGLSLTSVTKGLSTGVKNHFLRLRFGSSITSSTNNLPDENNCLIDPALDIKILDWWHPLYPQNGKIQLLPNDDY